jgi:hypothetical protein
VVRVDAYVGLDVVIEVVTLVWPSLVCGVLSDDDTAGPHDTRTSIAVIKAATIFSFTYYQSLNIKVSIFTDNLIVNTDYLLISGLSGLTSVIWEYSDVNNSTDK